MDPESNTAVVAHKAVPVYTYTPIPQVADTEGLGFQDHRRVTAPVSKEKRQQTRLKVTSSSSVDPEFRGQGSPEGSSACTVGEKEIKGTCQ